MKKYVYIYYLNNRIGNAQCSSSKEKLMQNMLKNISYDVSRHSHLYDKYKNNLNSINDPKIPQIINLLKNKFQIFHILSDLEVDETCLPYFQAEEEAARKKKIKKTIPAKNLIFDRVGPIIFDQPLVPAAPFPEHVLQEEAAEEELFADQELQMLEEENPGNEPPF